jgi:hypothetical protein
MVSRSVRVRSQSTAIRRHNPLGRYWDRCIEVQEKHGFFATQGSELSMIDLSYEGSANVGGDT